MPLAIDYSKGVALHRAHGHHTFLIEAKKAGKSKQFARNICVAVKCYNRAPENDWRRYLDPKL